MNKEQIKNKVIVFGGSHHNTLGVVRALGQKGINPYIVLVNDILNDSLVLKSKYVKKGWIFTSEDKALEHIFSEFSSEIDKPVIISTTDRASSFIDNNFDKLSKSFFIPNCGTKGHLSSLMDKEIMSHLAEETGLKVAKSWVIKDNTINEGIEFPSITKPLSSILGSKSDIQICHTKRELLCYLKESHNNNKILVQKFIEIDFEYQLIGCSLNGGKEVVIPGFTSIVRSTETTNTGFLKYLPLSDLKYDKYKSIKFIKACSYSGLFSLEFIRGKDGVDYFLEINFRNDGNAYAVTAAGVNLPYIWVASSVGKDITDELQKKIKPLIVMPEFSDIYHVYTGEISIRKWINDIRDTDCFLYYDKMDMKPFYFELRELLIFVMTKLPMGLYKNIFR